MSVASEATMPGTAPATAAGAEVAEAVQVVDAVAGNLLPTHTKNFFILFIRDGKISPWQFINCAQFLTDLLTGQSGDLSRL